MTPPRVDLFSIPYGDTGIRRTVGKMRDLSHEALLSPLVVETAALIVTGARTEEERAYRIRDWLASAVSFQPDPLGVELIRSPIYLLRQIQEQGAAWGDCDDVATLAAALGMAVGLPASFVLLGFDSLGPFSHVYTQLWTQGGWVEMDTTAPDQFPPGLQIVKAETHEV